MDALKSYWKQVARNCYFGLSRALREEGLLALEEHWRRIFGIEGADFELSYQGETLVLEVKRCPAISHMKDNGYPIAEDFCEHTRVINEEVCHRAGYKASCSYNQEAGSCVQRFWKQEE